MKNKLFRKGIVVGIIILFVGVSVVPSTGKIRNSIDKSTYQNSSPIINHTLPIDGATDIPMTGEHIVVEIYDADDDDLWVEIWSNFTGDWVEYASYDVMLDWKNRTWSNDSAWIVVDHDENGVWDVFDLSWIYGRNGWGCSGDWGFFMNRTPTDDWGMTKCRITYYWSVNVSDNTTWTNESFHFTTEIANIYVDDDFNESTPGWGTTHFNKIQDGIDAVDEGGIVYAYNGTYTEDLGPNLEYVRIEKSLNLFGESREHTIINCPSGDTGVWINTAHFNISGFTVLGANNPIQIGIYGQVGCNNVRIVDCIIHSFGEGIAFRYNTHNITITNCIAYNNTRNGGIALHENQENGIKNFEISRCTCYSNSNGIYIVNNSLNGIIYHNNLFNNSFNAVDNSGHIWNKSYSTCGNFWGDYWGDDLYSGPNQDILGPDGIGDIPYEIPCEHGTDYYPLMNPFELYYILNISAPEEVDEGELFNVVVTSIGGPVVPNALVGFNNEIIRTDENGRVNFTAPMVDEDTYYDIIAVKGEYYSIAYKTILMKNIPDEFEKAIIIGLIDNLTVGDVITFNAVNMRVIKFSPFQILAYKSGELITISRDYFGMVGARFIFAFCRLSYKSPTISMNIFSWDNASNKVIWLVSGVEGNPIGFNDVETILINEAGQSQPDAEITFNDTTGEGYISPGDTFTVIAPSDGNYTFLLTHKLTGETVFKSVLTHY